MIVPGSFAPVRTTFWTDPDVRTSLVPTARYLLLYYISAPHSNLIGLYSCPFEYVVRETGLDLATIRLHTHVTLKPFLTYDEKTEEVLVHGAAKHRLPMVFKPRDGKPKLIKRLVDDCHSPLLVALFHRKYAEWEHFLGAPPAIPAGYDPIVTRVVAPPVPTGWGEGEEKRGKGDENRRDEDELPPPSSSPAVEKLVNYLGAQHRELVEAVARMPKTTGAWAAMVLSQYGPGELLDTSANRIPEIERPAVLALALQRFAGEATDWNNPYFRSFVTRAWLDRMKGEAENKDIAKSAAAKWEPLMQERKPAPNPLKAGGNLNIEIPGASPEGGIQA